MHFIKMLLLYFERLTMAWRIFRHFATLTLVGERWKADSNRMGFGSLDGSGRCRLKSWVAYNRGQLSLLLVLF